MKFNSFSANMLKTYCQCPRKFYYRYVEKINLPQSASIFEKGKKIHAMAYYYLKKDNITRMKTALTKEESAIFDNLTENPYFKKDCVKSEFPLSCKINSYWIEGRIDAVVHDLDNYYILDYKTGSVPDNPKFDFQTVVYLLCLDKYLKTYDSLSFVYVNLKQNNNIVIEFDKDLKIEYTKRLEQICAQISADNTYKCNSKNCKTCEFVKLCGKNT